MSRLRRSNADRRAVVALSLLSWTDESHARAGPEARPIRGELRSLWRYGAALGVAEPRITLGEGWTPLVAGEWEGRPVGSSSNS